MKDPLSPDLLGAVCHELRGPLGAISNWVHVAGSESASADMRERALKGIVGDVRSMSQLIDRLQTVASALGASDATIGPVEIVSFVKELLQGREIRFETAEPSLLVLADPIRLKEMLVPLLERDPKALSLPPPTICLSAAGGTAEISLETPSPRAFIFVLARAAATSQGGECIQEAKGGRTVVRFRLRCAS